MRDPKDPGDERDRRGFTGGHPIMFVLTQLRRRDCWQRRDRRRRLIFNRARIFHRDDFRPNRGPFPRRTSCEDEASQKQRERFCDRRREWERDSRPAHVRLRASGRTIREYEIEHEGQSERQARRSYRNSEGKDRPCDWEQETGSARDRREGLGRHSGQSGRREEGLRQVDRPPAPIEASLEFRMTISRAKPRFPSAFGAPRPAPRPWQQNF